ncbi:LysM peptidoglycan-binding domain-containing protein [Pseudenhygromyxa sp. WMMC2535]|uniref:LysM peptidoglycan-binding domain-containing protein n=1 Tax=Pseudenhygromyxa sp. WMMC2535 TaxID=2712867 RepID=UPI001553F379|nr:LysM domain-containing protein [Pseudenhygromyxa sp. WMMC2535]NVB40399.1 LysM peptidoglycan-binding domain-containing protein [Pseudenhygromyxa sp. WMMC2535]
MITRTLLPSSALCVLALVGLQVEAAPPSGSSQGSAASTTTVSAGSGVSIGGFSAPSEASFDPNTTADPGVLDRQRQQTADQTYGPTGTGDQLGYDIVDTSAYLSDGYSEGIPDYHVVQEGDTLSGICLYYFGDMYLWPKIWSYNPHITNAHWIFPGDRIRLSDPYASGGVGGSEGDSLRYAKTYDPTPDTSQTYLLERYAFIDEEELDKSMEIVGGADPHVMMSTLDTAYIGYAEDNPPIPGERLSVYRKKKPVYDITVKGKKGRRQKKAKRIGWLVEVVGEVYIQEVAEKSAQATIVDSVRPVERGQRVGELKTRFVRVQPTANEATTNGLVVETIREQTINGETMFVIVNIGAEDGVRRGNTLDVVQKGDGYTPDHRLHQPYDKGYPREVYARLLVLQIEGTSALTVLTHSEREVVTGDHVELVASGEEAPDFDPYSAGRRGGSADADGSASSEDGSAEASGELRLGN